MGLVQNLKRILNNWVDKILAELSLAYILHLGKQTLKRQGNSSSKEFSPNHLVTEHLNSTIVTSFPDTLEKTTIILNRTDEMVDNIREWSVNQIASVEPIGSKFALYEEFEEWIDLDCQDSIEILSCSKKEVDKPSQE